MSTLADATLIQSAMESHRAEWLREGQHRGLQWQRMGDLRDHRHFIMFLYDPGV